MTFRITVLTGLLAVAGRAQEPITMHNNPLTIYNDGSIDFMFVPSTFILPQNYQFLGIPDPTHSLVQHTHPGRQDINIWTFNSTVGKVTDSFKIKDGDEIHLYLNGQPLSGDGQIVITRQAASHDAAPYIPAHAHLSSQIDAHLRSFCPTWPSGYREDQRARLCGGPAAGGSRKKASSQAEPVPGTLEYWLWQQQRATPASKLWVIQSKQGFTSPTRPNPVSNYMFSTYAGSSRMAALRIKHPGPSGFEDKTYRIDPVCGAVYFCHMKEYAYKDSDPDCASAIPLQCGPKGLTYVDPANTGKKTGGVQPGN
jgi:hypothetical protein